MKSLILSLLLTAAAAGAPPPKAILDAIKAYPIVYYREGQAEDSFQKEPRIIKTWNFLVGINGTPYPLIVPQTAKAEEIKSSYFALSCFVNIMAEIGRGHEEHKDSPEQENKKDNI